MPWRARGGGCDNHTGWQTIPCMINSSGEDSEGWDSDEEVSKKKKKNVFMLLPSIGPIHLVSRETNVKTVPS